ncbi:MAG: MFS transporter [Betaproteobacteria bacterium]|nr:MFS transporter [Betaproteobacteria bacterium]
MNPAARSAAELGARHWLAYGALGLPLAMAALPVYVHVPRFYAETVGMDLALLGFILLAARFADAGLDPLIGWWGDRRRARRGMILLALPCLALGMLALMHPPALHAAGWLALSLVITYLGYSLATIALQAWGAELGRNARERTLLTASREGFGLAGVVAAAVLPGLLAADAALGLSRLSWVFVALLAVLGGLTLLGTPAAQPTADNQERAAASPLGALKDAAFRRLLAVYVASGIAAALPATLVLFFVADVLQAAQWGGAFLALYFVAGAAGLTFWVRLARRIGRVRAWIGGMLLASLAFVWAYGLGAGDVAAFAAICLISGLTLGADLALPAALLADLAEREEASVRAGGYFGWWNLVTKLNLALAAGIALPLLAWLGYRPNASDGTAALSAVYCLLPVGFKLVSAALAWRWRKELEEFP